MKIEPPDAAKAEQIRQLREELLTVEEERLRGVTDHTGGSRRLSGTHNCGGVITTPPFSLDELKVAYNNFPDETNCPPDTCTSDVRKTWRKGYPFGG